VRAVSRGLVITGIAGSEVNVSSSVERVVTVPSLTVRVTPKLPSTMGVPDMTPVAGSALNPGGRPVALKRAVGLPPVVNTSKLKGCSVLAVTVLPLAITGPEDGKGRTVSVKVFVPVPNEFVAVK
jgi:hypothetical protein